MLIKRCAERRESERAEYICTEYLMEGALTAIAMGCEPLLPRIRERDSKLRSISLEGPIDSFNATVCCAR